MTSTRSSALERGFADRMDIVQPAAGPASLDNHIGGGGARYGRYQFDLIKSYVGRSMLEIGSGLGIFSEQFVDSLDYLAVTDADPYCLQQLAVRYERRNDVDVLKLELPGEIRLRRKVDTIVLMNVLEHIGDDAQALRDLAAWLEPTGHLIIWVPGYESLYGPYDRSAGHYRRYSPDSIRAVVEKAGLTLDVCKPVNFIGGIAWWLAVKWIGVRRARIGLVSLYDAIVVPATYMLERVFHPPFGQSVLCVATPPVALDGPCRTGSESPAPSFPGE